jgi:hypothetical protein
MLFGKALAEGVERTGADVAIHDPECAERECEEITPAVLLL